MSSSRLSAIQRSLLQDSCEIERLDWALAGAVSFVALAVYVVTLAPTVTGEDSGELIAASYLTGVAHPPGYPLWCILTRRFFLIPVGDMAWRANFASAFWGSATVLLVFLIARRWGACRLGSLVAAFGLAFSQRFWSQSIITEVYTLNMALLAAIVFLIEHWRHRSQEPGAEGRVLDRRRTLLLLGFLFGLSLTNHYMLMLLVAPGLAAMLLPEWRLLKRDWRYVLGAAGLGSVALLLYVYLPLAASRGPFVNWGDPSTWGGFWDHVLRRSYRKLEFAQHVTLGTKLLFIGHLARELWNQFSPYLLTFAPVGLYFLWRKDKARLAGSVAAFLANTVILILILQYTFERENRQRFEVWYLPAYMMAALWIGLGASRVLKLAISWLESRRREGSASRVFPRATRWLVPGCVVLVSACPLLPFLRHLEDNNRRSFWIAHDYAESILRTAENDAVVFPSADFTTFPLIYLIGVERMRPDVLLADKYGTLSEEVHGLFRKLAPQVKQATKTDIVRTILEKSGRPVYFTARSSFPSVSGYRLVPWGLLYKACPTEKLPGSPEALWANIEVRNLEGSAESDDPMERGLASAYYRMRAEFLLSRGRIREGTDLLERAAEIVSDDHKGLNNLGSIAAEYRQKDVAARFFEKALEVWPEYVTPHANLANIALEEGRVGDAAYHLAKAEQVDARHPMLTRVRKRLAEVRGPSQRLQRLLEEAKQSPGDPVVQNNLASALAEAGRFKEAVEHWEKALQLRPDYALPHRNLATVYERELKDPVRAEAHRREYERLRKGTAPDHSLPRPPVPGHMPR